MPLLAGFNKGKSPLSFWKKAALLPVLATDSEPEPAEKFAAACPISGEAKKTPWVGGQAVIEGVMMRGPDRWTVTVRRADGSLESQVTPYEGWAKRMPILGRPFLRGVVVLLESLIVGMKALNFSAEIAAQDEQIAEQIAEEKKKQETKQTESADDSANLSENSTKSSPKPTANQPQVLTFWSLALTLLAAFALAMGLFVALPHALSIWAGQWWGFNESSGWFHLLDGVLKFIFFILYVWGIGLIPDIGRVYAYHGAEHKAIFTFEQGQDLTPENAARQSTFHPRCGTAFIFLVLALSILFFAIIFPFIFPQGESVSFGRTVLGILLKIVLMFPLAGLAYEVTRQAGRATETSIWRVLLAPGLLLQRLTTRQPSKEQLEVAINALKKAVA